MANQADFNPKKILCPVDMSDLSDLALKYAQVGAQVFGAELTVLNALHFEYPRYLSREFTGQVLGELNRAKADARGYLEDHVRQVLGPATDQIGIHYRAVDFDAAPAILHAAEETRADLVVMGTHGLSGFKHWMLGSVAETVLHLSKVPVFTIRQKIDDFIDPQQPETRPAIHRILCPCNFTPSAAGALRTAAALSRRLASQLTVLHGEEEAAPDGKKRLKAWLEQQLPDAGGVTAVVRHGDAADLTITAAGELGSDLIVIGVCHQPFGAGTVVGRTSERVVRHAPVPVLAVPYFV